LYEANDRQDRWLIPLEFERLPEQEAPRAHTRFAALMASRRSVRDFTPDPVPRELVENAIQTAATRPGANKQP
jgi:iodotyrosine deiodinase